VVWNQWVEKWGVCKVFIAEGLSGKDLVHAGFVSFPQMEVQVVGDRAGLRPFGVF
jgi:hypothetical protein